MQGFAVRVRPVCGYAPLVVYLLGAVDGQEHETDTAARDDVGLGFPDDVRVREHHGLVGHALLIAERDEAPRKLLHHVEHQRRVAAIPLHAELREPVLLVVRAHERHHGAHRALVHLAAQFHAVLLVAVRATVIASIGGDEAER